MADDITWNVNERYWMEQYDPDSTGEIDLDGIADGSATVSEHSKHRSIGGALRVAQLRLDEHNQDGRTRYLYVKKANEYGAEVEVRMAREDSTDSVIGFLNVHEA